MGHQLSRPTAIFGLRLWVVLSICLGSAFVIILFIITLWLASSRSKHKLPERATTPVVSKEIQEIRVDDKVQGKNSPDHVAEQENEAKSLPLEVVQAGVPSLHINGGAQGSSSSRDQVPTVVPEVSHLGWGHWYTLRELEISTNGFVDDNVIGEGGYGIVYHGILKDGTEIAVKNLLNNRGQAEREFKVEVEAIGRVRHKNLVRLIGYCAEGDQRMLVYEYVNNGNLEQWLHGEVGPRSPLTWEIRLNIILETARGLTYLHEGLEPKVVHRDIKSSNILLDRQWNAKVSDFGLAKLLGSEKSYVSTRIMGTFGYVAPEYANSGMLNEKSDIYSFGILIMEIISGRNPVDYSRPSEEVNLVDWLKRMVSNRDPEGVLDPKLPEKPSPRALKKTLLVALRCVDQNAEKRPKMGQVVHMLEAEESPFKDGRKTGRQSKHMHHKRPDEGLTGNQMIESPDSLGLEIGVHPTQTR